MAHYIGFWLFKLILSDQNLNNFHCVADLYFLWFR